MITYTNDMLKDYMKNDWVYDLLLKNMISGEEIIKTNKWLIEMDNKRLIYADVYGDILKGKTDPRLKVLDVGGGINSLTKVLAKNTSYYLLDFLAHGGENYLQHVCSNYNIFWIKSDWYEALSEEYDVIIANDIFPDVDMRLDLFLKKALPRCKECRLVLTYYNTPKFYTTKRVDDSEIMTFLSWDGEILGMKMEKYLSRMDATKQDLIEMKDNYESIYQNGRQVCFIKLKGDLC